MKFKLSICLAVVALLAAPSSFAAQRDAARKSPARPQANNKRPQYRAYMAVTGQRQGKFRGGGRSKNGLIPVIRVVQNAGGSGIDHATGQPNGKRGRSSVQIVFDAVDGNEFDTAYKTHEVLTSVEISFFRPNQAGKMSILRTVTLTNATIKSLQVVTTGRGRGGAQGKTTASFDYQSIKNRKGGGKTPPDDWMN